MDKTKSEALKSAIENGILKIEIREGEALKMSHPESVKLSGRIDSPLRFLTNRKADFKMNKVFVAINRAERTIHLHANEHLEHGWYTVDGSIELSNEFTGLKINQNSSWTPELLSHHLKLKRSMFPNAIDHAKIVKTLKDLKATVNNEIEKKNDSRGNVDAIFRQTVQSNMPEQFDIEIPLFKGGEKYKVPIQVTLEVQSGEIVCFLESVEGAELIDEVTEKLLDEQVSEIEKFGVLILEK